MRARLDWSCVGAAAFVLLAASPSAAQPVPVSVQAAPAQPGPRAGEAPLVVFGPTESARLAHVEATLAADRRTSLRWYAGWTGVFAASAGVRGVLWAASNDRDLVAESRVVCVLSILGVLSTAPVVPASLFGDDDPGPDATPAARRAYLERRESRLTKAAEIERFGRAPLTHFASLVVSASAGIYLWKVDGLPGRGALTALTSVLASEAKIWTQPTRALRTAPVPSRLPWMTALAIGITPVTGPQTGTGALLVGVF